uniref:Uncharacterized protein n=1 Tax=Arundo donax TaxID=35708 RepID=A0A0A8ZI65_ARUDO
MGTKTKKGMQPRERKERMTTLTHLLTLET